MPLVLHTKIKKSNWVRPTFQFIFLKQMHCYVVVVMQLVPFENLKQTYVYLRSKTRLIIEQLMQYKHCHFNQEFFYYWSEGTART
jgi:hypothetical protein